MSQRINFPFHFEQSMSVGDTATHLFKWGNVTQWSLLRNHGGDRRATMYRLSGVNK